MSQLRMFRGSIPGATVIVNRRLERMLNELGGVRSPEMRAAGNVLAKSIRKTLSTPGGGVPSAPGQPPRRQKGSLAKSVKAGPVADAVRVAVLRFTGRLLEEGVNAEKGKGRATGTIEARARARRTLRARSWTRKAKRTLRIAARPFMGAALEAVQDKLAGVFVTRSRQRLERA